VRSLARQLAKPGAYSSRVRLLRRIGAELARTDLAQLREGKPS
jgi:hypothetical protein